METLQRHLGLLNPQVRDGCPFQDVIHMAAVASMARNLLERRLDLGQVAVNVAELRVVLDEFAACLLTEAVDLRRDALNVLSEALEGSFRTVGAEHGLQILHRNLALGFNEGNLRGHGRIEASSAHQLLGDLADLVLDLGLDNAHLVIHRHVQTLQLLRVHLVHLLHPTTTALEHRLDVRDVVLGDALDAR